MNNRKMKVYKNVVVERIHTNLTFPETIPCYANFDYSNPIGVAILKYVPIADVRHSDTSAQIWADICLFEDKWSTPNHWPILGIRYENETEVNGTVMCLAISNRANADKMINPLGEVMISGTPYECSITPNGHEIGWTDVKYQDDNPIMASANVLPNPVKCECSTDYAFGCFKNCDRKYTDRKSKTINISDPDFRIIPKDTPLEWGSMDKPFIIKNHIDQIKGVTHLNLCQCIIPEYLPNEHGDMTCIKCGHYPNPINPFANIL